jgi:hypothetical protein
MPLLAPVMMAERPESEMSMEAPTRSVTDNDALFYPSAPASAKRPTDAA